MEKEKEKREEEEKEKGKRRAVPKFGSFKPNLTPESAPESAPETRPASKERRAHKDGLSGAEKDRSDRRHHERDRGRDGDRHGEQRHSSHLPPRPGSPRAMSSRNKTEREGLSTLNDDLFVIDKRGDLLIVQFGTNDRSQIPVYYRFGAGKVIGSPGFLTIHRDGAQEQFSIRGPGEGSSSGSAFRDKALVAAAFRARSKRIQISEANVPTTPEDFIPLGPSRKRKRTDDDPSDQPLPDYRSIHGEARANVHLDSDLDSSDSESDLNPHSHSRSHPCSPSPKPTQSQPTPLTRAAHLSRHTSSSPSKPNTPPPPTTITARTPEEMRALAELKLALYQEALPHAATAGPAERERERLVLGMMREAGRVWGEEALARKWEELVAEEKGGVGFGLWRARLDFEMGRAAGFGVERVREEIVGRLAGLGGRLADYGRGGEGGEEQLCGQAVYVFLRLTRFFHDAGFVELAVAAWQAMLEMVFCRPRGDFATAEVAMASFAGFWESEVARIGEEGARGWRHFVETGEDMADPPEPRADGPSEVPRMTDPFEAWAAAEQQAAGKARMPARTLDEGMDDDPFRVIMFSDIKDLLIWIPSALLSRVKPLLADAFLVFCGLPPAGLSGGEFTTMLDDPFVSSRGQGLDLGLSRKDTGATQDLSRRTPEFKQEGGSMVISPDVLFSRDPWSRYLNKWSDTHQPGDRQVDISWVLSTLERLVKDCGVEALAEYYLAMEWLNEPTKARKVAKGLLKQYSSNIKLYNAYALVESANGNAEVSHKVLSSATGLQLKNTTQYAESLMLLEYLTSEARGEPAYQAPGNLKGSLSAIQNFSPELEAQTSKISPPRTPPPNHRPPPLPPRHPRPPLRITDPVRTTLHTLSLTPPHARLGTRRFALHHAARAGAGTVHAVRAEFEAALGVGEGGLGGGGGGCAELWVRYVRFCCGERELRGVVKGVFYRAVGACPGVKEVYLEGLRAPVLREVLGEVEVRAVREAMVDRGLRVHVDFWGR
ncbi:hypothetical protein CHGG_05652 [Chaetomium globosum CBS 148.51]|uniref:Uncharacterized protein n=1 Tax=Chaetomium globosum (strain ATCC 6205 / CBS 148.51 / DSM 1962 / NBRC 6347 / NRRL 1970) TaxID=306901 RepID=Q2H6R3_CHAGB|nr:uncharacterized protein CHGG_05652 [Chaetomium globosum CBS 148.51]EAQ89033.1 hypothetical protein CHGG_05652 [Chaetomium globosum CBS 148.51]